MNEIILNNNNFKQEISNTDKLVLIDFFATWCGPCQMLSPIIEELSKYYKDKVIVCKINTDDNQELAIEYNIISIPTILFFKNNQLIKREIGYRSKAELINIINELL